MNPTDILEHADRGRLWPAVDGPPPDDVAAAYRDALAVRSLRIARGERPVGYKIGFTNRTIWDRYRVHAPIWGSVWDSTLSWCADGGSDGRIALGVCCQPRIEPEIVFGFARVPPPDVSLDGLFDCVEWLAAGFEIVQSHRRDWQFTAAETIADGGLHARLLVGPRTPLTAHASSGTQLDERLAATRLRLYRGDDDTPVDEGTGANVLDGPLHALLHFVRELAACPGAPTIRPGDVVTTGTWTDAWPVAPGETWRSVLDAPFDGLTVHLD